jgi:hypothetical protein
MTYSPSLHSFDALDALDALDGIVAAHGGTLQVATVGDRTHVTARFAQPRWTTPEGLHEFDRAALEFRRSVYPAIKAAGFGMTGTTHTHNLRGEQSVFYMNFISGPLSDADERCIATFTGRD